MAQSAVREDLAAPAPQTVQRRGGPWALIVALGMGVFVGGFDQTFVVPVLSRILRDFDIPIDQFGRASWIINGYLLGYAVAMPLMGRVADVYGHLRVFVAGIAIFVAGSVAVALSPNLEWLTVARAVTALGGGALVPVALAIAADTLPRRQRPLGMSAVSVADDASSLLGPLWGTLIGVWLGWRGLFWMNIVLSLPVLAAVLLLARDNPQRQRGGRVDWAGGVLLTGGLFTLTFALADVSAGARPAAETVGLYAVSVLLLSGFVAWERRAAVPLVDLSSFRSRGVAIASAVFFLEGGALITALVNVPLMAETLWGLTGTGPGLMLMRMVLFMILGGALGGVLAVVAGYRVPAVLGAGLAAVGLFLMTAWPEQPAEWQRLPVLAIAGLGFTLADAALYATVTEATEPGRRASSLAMLQVCQTLGMVVGMAVLASQGLGRFDERAADLFQANVFNTTPEQYRAIIHRTFDETFFAAALLMSLAAVLCFALRGRHSPVEAAGEGAERGRWWQRVFLRG